VLDVICHTSLHSIKYFYEIETLHYLHQLSNSLQVSESLFTYIVLAILASFLLLFNMQGNRAIAEIQFADYIFPAFDQACL
jgi:hypothetical protein